VGELHAIKIALIYTETVIEVLTGELKNPPYTFLANRFAYAQKFDETRANRGGDVEPPWPDRMGRSFWGFYFEQQRPLEAIKGQQAWHGVAPFRHRFPLKVTSVPHEVRAAPEAFVYPHGVAVVINLIVSGKFTPEEAATLAIRLRRGDEFTADGEERLLVVDGVADRAVTALRQASFGADAPVGRRPHFPFTVTTVVLGKDVDDAMPPAEGGSEHRFLEAVTTWAPTWKSAALPKLADATLPVRTSGTPAGHVLYRRDRGRAVWFPGSFTTPAGSVRTLACYHRNLVLASLQVESLAGFGAATAQFLADGGKLSDAHYDAATRVGDVLGRFYGGAQSIYRSRSLHRQVEDGNFVAEINAMRAAVGRNPLFVAS
jgi:hypothetical protein